MQRPVIGEGVLHDVDAEQQPLRARGRHNGFCYDEAVQLICPTCQVSAQSVGSGDRRLLCMGLFSIFFGARAPATRRQ